MSDRSSRLSNPPDALRIRHLDNRSDDAHPCVAGIPGRNPVSETMKHLPKPLSALLALALLGLPVWGQDHQPSLTGCHAIKGVTVITEPGQQVENATVILRAGRIAKVQGADNPIPDDADVLDATGSTVVAGFVLAGAEIEGPKKPEETERSGRSSSSPKDAAATPSDPDRLGLHPEHRASEWIQESPFEGKDWLKQGVTAVLLKPKGSMIQGQGSLVSCGPGLGIDRILLPDCTMHVSFRSGRRGYPYSLMGVVAALRQAYLDAERYQTWARAFEKDRNAVAPPPMSPGYTALSEARENEVPTVFQVRRPGDVARGMQMAKEFDLNPWFMGGSPLIRGSGSLPKDGAIAFLDLDVAEPRQVLNRHRVEDGPDSEPSEKDLKKLPEGEALKEAAEREAAEEWRRLGPHIQGSHKLTEGGARLAFAADKPLKVLENVRRQMNYGLTADQALAALTTTPAALLGAANFVGKVAPGYTGNVVVLDKAPFEEKARILHVFCDGERFDLPKPKEKKSDKEDEGKATEVPEDQAGLAGTWLIERENRNSTLTLKWGTDGWTGEWESEGPGPSLAVDSISYDEGTLVANCTMTMEEDSVEVIVTGEMDDKFENISGTIKFGSWGETPFKATKKPEGALR